MSNLFNQNDTQGIYLPIDLDAEIVHSRIESHEEISNIRYDSDINSISKFMSVLELEVRRSSSYRRSWLKDQKRTRSALFKLRILTNDIQQVVFNNPYQDSECSAPRQSKTIEETKSSIKKEKIWSAFYFQGWMNERSQRQRLKFQVASML